MKKILLLSLLFAIFYNKSIAQKFTCGVVPSAETTVSELSGSCSRSSSLFLNKYRLQSCNLYMPSTFQARKKIKVNIIVWQDGNGNNNFTTAHLPGLNAAFNRLKEIYLTNSRPSDRSDVNCGIQFIPTTNIEFVLGQILFIRDNDKFTHNCSPSETKYSNYTEQRADLKNAINIHLVSGLNPCYFAGYASFHNGASTIVSLMGYHPTHWGNTQYPGDLAWANEQAGFFWGAGAHFAHEIGHLFGLQHPYVISPNTYAAESYPNSPDYLSDLFCVHPIPHGGLNNQEIESRTNNVMGGVASESFTPLQIGRIHRTLSDPSTGKIACGYGNQPYLIETDEVWDFEKKMYNDIKVKTGKKLTIKCKLYMVPEAKIILEGDAKLIIDGGIIDVAKECGNKWEGIYLNNVRAPTNILNGTIRNNPPNVVLLSGGLAKNIRTTNVPIDTPTPAPHLPVPGRRE